MDEKLKKMDRTPASEKREKTSLFPYITPLGTWAFSISTAIGWGSFVVTCSSYLSQGGILGTVLGLVLGMCVILIINRNLVYSIERSQDPGGIYTYGRKVCNYDIGFLIAWFLLLAYIAVFWANITSLPLFARQFLGKMFQWGYCYTVFGYDVFLGEVLLSVGVMALVGLLCIRSQKVPHFLVILMTFIFMGAVIICTAVTLLGHKNSGFSFSPAFLPNKRVLSQIVRIAVISPWAFIGFENVAHFSAEFNYPVRKIRGVLLGSVLLSTLFYILMSLLSVTSYLPEYANWLEYIRDMNNLEGIKALPAFYAAEHYMGAAGIDLLMMALLSVVLTSIITNMTAVSHLLYAFGRDHDFATRIGELNSHYIPGRAILIVLAISALIPFLGRTAIGWIVDVTTIGATVIYGFLSYAVYCDAKSHRDRYETVTGLLGMAIMICFAVLLLVPKLMSYEAMASESYMLFAAWSMLGLLQFRYVLRKDKTFNYGKSVVVWVILLLLMLLTAMMWMNRSSSTITEKSMQDIDAFYQGHFEEGTYPKEDAEAFLSEQTERIENANSRRTYIAYGLFILSVLVMLNNFRTARERESRWEAELKTAKQMGATDSLTGVKNKHAYTQWEERIDAQISSGDCSPFAVVVCDVNDLKRINDTLGHKAGDQVIRDACSSICRTFKHSPVFRTGGDEFVVIINGEDFPIRHELVEQVTSRSEERIRSGQYAIAIGMVDYDPNVHKNLLSVFEPADKAMYEHKRHLKDIWYRPDSE